MASTPPLLTAETAPDYVRALPNVLQDASSAKEISGGNLNYAFEVSNGSKSVFLKQTPGYVKVLGPEAKISDQRLDLERSAYTEWAASIPPAHPAASCLPEVLHFDSARKVMVLEFLGSAGLLHERLVEGDADKGAAHALGTFLGVAHATTHSTVVSAERAAALTSAFANSELRGLQLEYVFSKCYREAERAATLRDDAAFMAEVESLKAAYRGETTSNLSLCHGDCHAGSVMVEAKAGTVKVIDPEFAVYGPPGLDLGCLLSSYLLAAVYRSYEGSPGDVPPLEQATRAICAAYKTAITSTTVGSSGGGGSAGDNGGRRLAPEVCQAIEADAVGFAGCEVARTALGFAGVRGLSISDAAAKAKAEATALGVAERCIRARAQGLEVIFAEMKKLAARV